MLYTATMFWSFIFDAETNTINAVLQASMKNKSYKVTVSIHIFISSLFNVRCTLFYMRNVICLYCFLKHYETKKKLYPIAIVIKDDRNRDTRENSGSCDITVLHPRAILLLPLYVLLGTSWRWLCCIFDQLWVSFRKVCLSSRCNGTTVWVGSTVQSKWHICWGIFKVNVKKWRYIKINEIIQTNLYMCHRPLIVKYSL